MKRLFDLRVNCWAIRGSANKFGPHFRTLWAVWSVARSSEWKRKNLSLKTTKPAMRCMRLRTPHHRPMADLGDVLIADTVGIGSTDYEICVDISLVFVTSDLAIHSPQSR